MASPGVPSERHSPEPGSAVGREPAGVVTDAQGLLSLTATRIEGVLRSPDGAWRMTASPEGWADLERHVAAGRNPVLLQTLLADTDGEINR